MFLTGQNDIMLVMLDKLGFGIVDGTAAVVQLLVGCVEAWAYVDGACLEFPVVLVR